MPDSPDEPGRDGRFDLAGLGGPTGLDDAAFVTIGETVKHAAGAIDGLKDILGRLQSSVAEATEQRRNDIEIGLLFTRAQDFVERAVTEGHELAQRIVADAEFEAVRIITAAKAEAHRLIEEATDASSLPPQAVTALQATIEEFSRMNNALVQELSAVKEALASNRPSRPMGSQHTPSEGPSGAPFGESASPTERLSWPESHRANQSPSSTWPLSPDGYWSTLRPRRGAADGRVGRHSAPGAPWRIR